MTRTARNYAGKDAGQRAAERRERFLEAGLDLFGTQGVQATSLRAVLTKAGLASQYFYEHFTDLDQFQGALADQLLEEAQQVALTALTGTDGDARVRVRAAVIAVVDLLLDDPRKGRYLAIESFSSPAAARHRLTRTDDLVGLVAAYGAAMDIDLPEHVARTGAHFLLNGLAGVLAATLLGHLDTPREDIADLLIRLLAQWLP